jgi:hypothetical protein
MKTLIHAVAILSLVLATSSAFADAPTKRVLNFIAQNAEVGNGSTNLKTYDPKNFDVVAAMKSDLKQVKKEFPKCGPFNTTSFRRESIEALRKVTSDAQTADALADLYRKGKISKMYTIHTNNEIDCSRMWIEVYTTDGDLLEIYYGMND